MMMMMMKRKVVSSVAYDYKKLSGKIVEKCETQANFAEQMGLSERTVSLKLNNKISWKQTEIQKAMKILGLSDEDIQSYFFTMKVQ
jgi:transcriptional antiterminator